MDETTTLPTMSHIYASDFDGQMQVRVTDSEGRLASVSAPVLVTEGRDPDATPVLEAPDPLNAEVLDTTGSVSSVRLVWTPPASGADSWGVALNGVALGRVSGDVTTITVTDVDRTAAAVFSVRGLDPDGNEGVPAEAVVPVQDNGVHSPPAPLASSPPIITGIPRFGDALTVSPGTWSPSDVTISYQWTSNGVPIPGARRATYAPELGDVGRSITATVTALSPSAGSGSATASPVTIQEGEAASALTAPSVAGLAKVGGTLTASDGAWNRPGVALSRQWLRDGFPIPGAVGSTYLLGESDFGAAFSVRVTAKEEGYVDGSADSGTLIVAAGDGPAPTAPPSITGTPAPGRWLIAGSGQWSRSGLTFAYQWLRDGSPIDGSTGRSYKVMLNDLGHELAIRVTASREAFETGEATSPAVVPKTGATMSARLAKRVVAFGKAGRAIVTLSANGVRPTGFVDVLSDGVVIGRQALPPRRRDKVSIRLLELPPGIHNLEVRYSGDSKVGARAVHRTLRVRQH